MEIGLYRNRADFDVVQLEMAGQMTTWFAPKAAQATALKQLIAALCAGMRPTWAHVRLLRATLAPAWVSSKTERDVAEWGLRATRSGYAADGKVTYVKIYWAAGVERACVVRVQRFVWDPERSRREYRDPRYYELL